MGRQTIAQPPDQEAHESGPSVSEALEKQAESLVIELSASVFGGDFRGAATCIEELHRVYAERYGSDHWHTTSYDVQARELEGIIARCEADAAYQQTLSNAFRVHARVAELFHEGRLEEALEVSQRLEEFTETLEATPFHLAGFRDTRSRVLCEIARFPPSEAAYEEAFKSCKDVLVRFTKLLGSDHAYCANVHDRIGNLHGRQKSYGLALKECNVAMAIREKSVGLEDHTIVFSYLNMGVAYTDLRQFGQANHFYRLAARRAKSGEAFAVLCLNRGKLALAQRDFDTADQELKQAFAWFQKYLPRSHPLEESLCEEFAELYEEAGRGEESRFYSARAQLLRLRRTQNDFIPG